MANGGPVSVSQDCDIAATFRRNSTPSVVDMNKLMTVPGVLAAALLMSACGAEFVTDEAEPRSAVSEETDSPRTATQSPTGLPEPQPSETGSTESQTPQTETPEPEPTEPSPEGDPEETEWSQGNYADWMARIAPIALKEISCTDAPVTLAEDAAVVRLLGSCGEVLVSGAGSTVLADDIETLRVDSDASVVVAKDLGALSLSGAGNSVHWVTGDPEIDDTGTINVAISIPED